MAAALMATTEAPLLLVELETVPLDVLLALLVELFEVVALAEFITIEVDDTAEVEAADRPDAEEETQPLSRQGLLPRPNIVKLAQVMTIMFMSWMTMERFPMKASLPLIIEI